MEEAAETSRRMASQAGRIVLLTGELGRREGWRAEGATSLEAWIVERCGVSVPTARAWAHVGERLFDLPHLAAGLSEGELSFDKVRAVVGRWPRPRRIGSCGAGAGSARCTQLAAEADRSRGASSADGADGLRDALCPLQRHLSHRDGPAPARVLRRGPFTLEAGPGRSPSDGETPWDQRLCDAFLEIVRSVVEPAAAARMPSSSMSRWPALLDESSELAGELERGELISGETVRRIACDTTIDRRGRRRRRPHDVRGPGPTIPDRDATPGDHAAGPTLPVPGVHQRHVHQRAPHQAVETGGRTDLENLALALRAPPSPGAQPANGRCPETPTRS